MVDGVEGGSKEEGREDQSEENEEKIMRFKVKHNVNKFKKSKYKKILQ